MKHIAVHAPNKQWSFDVEDEIAQRVINQFTFDRPFSIVCKGVEHYFNSKMLVGLSVGEVKSWP